MSMTGKGGGIFYVPLLTIIGLELDDAVASSQVIIALSATASFLIFRKSKVIDWKLILIVEPFTVVFSFLGGYLSSSLPNIYLKSLFIVSIILPILFLLKKPEKNSVGKFTMHRSFGNHEYNLSYLSAIIISSSAGLISGLVGVAGGSIKVPLFIGFCGVPTIVAIGSSSIMILFTSVSSITGQYFHSNLDFMHALPYAAAAIAGNFIGSKVSLQLSDKTLKYLIIGTSLVALLLMIVA